VTRGTPDPLSPRDGLAVLHLFCRPDDGFDPVALGAARDRAIDRGIQVVTAAMLGHRGSLGLMALGPDWWGLRAFQTEVEGAGARPVASYVSLTEVSEYAPGLPEHLRAARLFPRLPPEGMAAFCFYPMAKRRQQDANWYLLDFEARRALMAGHGALGRTFHGRVLQVITGSTGLDDWEWGVTLFGVTPDDLKACVYEMRFDEASARYAEFGPFYSGMVAPLEEVLGVLGSQA
jgi:hydrogen peroxide-dependent heme synthase